MKLSDTVKLNKRIWDVAGNWALSRIREDASKGKPQSGSKNSYSSKGQPFAYRDYKANSMKKFGRGPNKIGAGQRLKGYEGASINTVTNKVTANLTGETLRRITVKSAKNFTELNYQRGQVVEGLQDMDYNIQDLSSKNLTSTTNKISEYIGNNIKKYAKDDMIINVGKR